MSTDIVNQFLRVDVAVLWKWFDQLSDIILIAFPAIVAQIESQRGRTTVVGSLQFPERCRQLDCRLEWVLGWVVVWQLAHGSLLAGWGQG